MNKHLSIIFLNMSFLLFVGCMNLSMEKEKEKHKTEIDKPKKQIEFDNIHITSTNKFLKAKSEEEKYKSLETFTYEIYDFINNHKLFVNWKGEIKNISFNSAGDTLNINCIISYKPTKEQNITFWCDYSIPKDSISKDYIYNKLKNISPKSNVYFDGFISRNLINSIQYKFKNNYGSIFDPNYVINLIDIDTIRRVDTLPKNLEKVVDTHFKIFELLRKKSMKQIEENEFKSQTEVLLPQGLDNHLTNEQKPYSDRIKILLYKDLNKL